MKNRKQGFTLIELLVVIAIIGVLFTLIMPAVASSRERARIASCMNNMKQIAMAAFMYADDHDNVIPDVKTTLLITGAPLPNISSYVDDENVYICPRDIRDDLGATKPSYTAFKDTPPTLLPSDLGGLHSEKILYIESLKSAVNVDDRESITADDIHYRHDNRTVIVFADGHVFQGNESQVAQLMTGANDDTTAE